MVGSLRRLPDELAVDYCSDFEQQLAAERLLAVARVTGSSGNPGVDRRRARNTMSTERSRSRSGRSVNRDARRAAAVAAYDRLGGQLSDGLIAPDTIDALAKAADGETGEIPIGLIDAVAGLAPDQAARVVDEHLESAADPDDVESEYRRQREARRVYCYESLARNGLPALSGIAVEGPRAEVDRLWTQISVWADTSYQADGGRDRPST